MQYDRKQMKRSAREAAKIAVPNAMLVTLVFWLLTTALVAVIQALVPSPFSNVLSIMTAYPELVEESPELLLSLLSNASGAAVITVFVTIVLSLYSAVMNYGYKGYALRLYRRENPGYSELFAGFPKAGSVIGAAIMSGIYSFLWILLGLVGFVAVVAVGSLILGESMLLIPLYLVLYAALIVYLFWALYRYVLVPYFVMDQGFGAFEAIRASREAMRGNKRKYFVLEISFFGWGLLVVLIELAVILLGTAIGAILSGAGVSGMLTGAWVNPAALITSSTVATVVGSLVALPLELWVMKYTEASYAGFYQCLMAYNSRKTQQPQGFAAQEEAGESGFDYHPVEPVLSTEEPEKPAERDEAPADEEGESGPAASTPNPYFAPTQHTFTEGLSTPDAGSAPEEGQNPGEMEGLDGENADKTGE